jgi:hypothetical protein
MGRNKKREQNRAEQKGKQTSGYKRKGKGWKVAKSEVLPMCLQNSINCQR